MCLNTHVILIYYLFYMQIRKKVLSKNKISFIRSLKEKKYRLIHCMFVAEGNKIITELIESKHTLTEEIFATERWLADNKKLVSGKGLKITPVSAGEIQKISSFKTPQEVLAVLRMPESHINPADIKDQLVLALDAIQDPGNFGTMIRLCDWFGIRHIVCSGDTADCFNPKVLQATMGSIFRVNVWYTELFEFIRDASEKKTEIYGTFTEGSNVYTSELTTSGILILGNESRGIRKKIWPYITQKLVIPSFNRQQDAADSLNVATAAAIFCSEFRRRAAEV